MNKKAFLFFFLITLLQNVQAITFEPEIILINTVENQKVEQTIILTNNQKKTQTKLDLFSQNENIAIVINKPISLLSKDSVNKTIKINEQEKGYYYTTLNLNNQIIPLYLAVSSNTQFDVPTLFIQNKELIFEVQNLENNNLNVSVTLKTLTNKDLAKSKIILTSNQKKTIPTKIPKALLPTNYVVLFETENQTYLKIFQVPTLLNKNQLMIVGISIPLFFGIIILFLKHKKKRINL